jgi:hypothetical protein
MSGKGISDTDSSPIDLATTSKRRDISTNIQIHGILGQTVVYRYAPEKSMDSQYLEGQVNDYIVQSNDIFGDDFAFNRFKM